MSDEITTPRAAHWEAVYGTKPDGELSWHQDEPEPSLGLIREWAPPGGRVIDVGGGNSILAGRLVAMGFEVTVLDVSAAAVERGRARLGDPGRKVRWIVADVAEAPELQQVDLWHDRAAFHFLTDAPDRRRYLEVAQRTVRPGGHLVIGTFASDGPPACSGLPVERYDEPALAAAFAPAFTLVQALQSTHVTPWGKPQSFLFAVLARPAAHAH